MQRLLPGPSKLVRLALCALAVYGSARLMANVSAEFVPGQKWAALLASAAGAIAAGACGMVGLKLIEWRELYRRLRTQGS
jgi:hypothetical protein